MLSIKFTFITIMTQQIKNLYTVKTMKYRRQKRVLAETAEELGGEPENKDKAINGTKYHFF